MTPTPSKQTDLTEPSKDVGFPALLGGEDSKAVASAMQNFEELGVSPFKLSQIRVPAGGSTQWAIPTSSGEDEYAPTIEGIVVMMSRGERAWWRIPYDESGGGTPPDCSSVDGLSGYGIRVAGDGEAPEASWTTCRTCAWDKFGSTRGKGKGKDCREAIRIFLYRSGKMLPSVINVSPGSMDAIMTWAVRLMEDGLSFDKVLASFRLEKGTSQTGIEYSVIKPSVVRPLEPSEIKSLEPVRDIVRAYITKSKVSPDAAATEAATATD